MINFVPDTWPIVLIDKSDVGRAFDLKPDWVGPFVTRMPFTNSVAITVCTIYMQVRRVRSWHSIAKRLPAETRLKAL